MATRLFNAGTIASNFHINGGKIFDKLTTVEKQMRQSNNNFLESYAYVKSDKAVKRMRGDGMRIFLDSGAFTAWSKGIEIDIDEYIDYCHQNTDILEIVSVLDVIDFSNPARAAKETYHNVVKMLRRGVKNVLPTFHMGEPEEAIEYYAANFPYVSLGGMVGVSPKQLMLWLDRIWSKYLVDATGRPKIKVHGFGMTSLPVMERYPWYSVDSSTWVQWSASGMLLLPWRGMQINISNRSSFRKQKDQHLTTYCAQVSTKLENEIIKYGGDIGRLSNYYYSRWAFNYWAFPFYLQHNANKGVFVPEYTGIFDEEMV